MSKYYDLLEGVSDSIASAVTTRVTLRDDLFLLEGEAVPLIIVAPGPSFEKIRMQTFQNNVVYDYPVLVAYVIAGNRSVGSDLRDYLETRQAIRDQLYQVKAPGLTEAFDTNMQTGAVSKFGALVGSNYRVTGWEMTYSVSEVRLGA